MKEMADYWGAHDVYFEHAKSMLHTGWVHQCQEFIADEELLASPYYNEFAVREEMFHQCGAIIAHEETRSAVLTLLRGKQAGQFGESQLRLLRSLLPHVQRATEIHYRLASALRQRSQMEAVIDRLPFALVLVNDKGKALFANRAAREMFQKHQSVWVENGLLTGCSLRFTTRLQAAINRAARALQVGDAYSGEIFKIERAASGRPLAITVTPLPPRQDYLPGGTSAAVFISDPDSNDAAPGEVLHVLFGLTPAEARLAAALFGGNSLEEAGDTLGVTRNTLATQLKSIFSKTNTRRQSELVRFMGVLYAQRIQL
jgi:DNA-binding CsgD family transcriptional regulator/PAS domain-containing protein